MMANGDNAFLKKAQAVTSPAGFVGVLVLLVITLTANPWTSVDQARFELNHSKEHASERALIDQRLVELSKTLDRIATMIERHVSMDMHPGSAQAFAKLQADMDYLKVAVAEIKKKMNGD